MRGGRLDLLVITDGELVPPRHPGRATAAARESWAMTRDVALGLARLGHCVTVLGLRGRLDPLARALDARSPDLVVNLLEGFHGYRYYDQHVASYLELRGVAYTGCCPRGLVLARDKALAKRLVSERGIETARFVEYPQGDLARRARPLAYPVVVKPLAEDASLGISNAAVARTTAELRSRVRWVHRALGLDAMAEEYVPGRELYVPVLGNDRLQVLPAWELRFSGADETRPYLASARAKHDTAFRRRRRIREQRARLAPALARQIAATSREIYRALGLTGYARLDYRLVPEGRLYFLEANPNPDIARDGVFARAARARGISYTALLRRILGLGTTYARWNGVSAE